MGSTAQPSTRVDVFDTNAKIWWRAELSFARGSLTAAATDRVVAFAGGDRDSFTVSLSFLFLSLGVYVCSLFRFDSLSFLFFIYRNILLSDCRKVGSNDSDSSRSVRC